MLKLETSCQAVIKLITWRKINSKEEATDNETKMSITEDCFGATSSGNDVKRYILSNNSALRVEILNYGGIIRALNVPDKKGNVADVVNGFDDVKGYEERSRYFGALIGRVANRIAKGKFTLEGKEYSLVVNNGPNHLHGGTVGFDKRVWSSEIVDGPALRLTLDSPDGEEGYPGHVTVTVTYSLSDDNELVIDYSATTSQPTPINLTNHSYFNLAGHDAADIYDHVVTLGCDRYTPVDDTRIPTGEIASVAGSVFDLRAPTRLWDVLYKVPGGGFDHNFVVSGDGDKKFVARVEHEASGRVMEVYTSQPGVQFYTSNFLCGQQGKGGVKYEKHSSFCLETQNYPDAVNKPNFLSPVLKPGEVYRHTTWYRFSTNE